MQFIHTIFDEAARGNFSFFILVISYITMAASIAMFIIQMIDRRRR